jgi:hypothetical protein
MRLLRGTLLKCISDWVFQKFSRGKDRYTDRSCKGTGKMTEKHISNHHEAVQDMKATQGGQGPK